MHSELPIRRARRQAVWWQVPTATLGGHGSAGGAQGGHRYSTTGPSLGRGWLAHLTARTTPRLSLKTRTR